MRLFVFLLIFANLIFFAYSRGYLGGEAVSEAGRLEAQVQPERLHLMWRPGDEPDDADRIGLPKEDIEVEAPEELSGNEAPREAEPESAPASASPAAPVIATVVSCLAVSSLNTVVLDELEKKAEAARLETRRRVDGSWWVFIPSQGSKEAADKKASELRQFGVKDFFIVADGPQKFAISLGVFSQEEGARRHLEALRGKNVRSARAEARHPETARATLEIRGGEKEIKALREQLPAETEARACPKA